MTTTTAQTTITDWEARRYALICNRLSEASQDDEITDAGFRIVATLGEADRLYGPGSTERIARLERERRACLAHLVEDPPAPRTGDLAEIRAKARAELAARNQPASMLAWAELAPDIYGTHVHVGGLRATAHMERGGGFWVEVSRHGVEVSSTHTDTLTEAMDWAAYEIRMAARKHS